tara:strand:- start:2559 stop:4835 length:2277 start_codon:yes stop_codon:yes gene_type:complete
MSTEYFETDEQRCLIQRFNNDLNDYYNKANELFQKWKNEPDEKKKGGLLRILKSKYPHYKKLNKRSKHTSSCKILIHQLFEIITFKEKYTETQIKHIYEYNIFKITGLYKHAQAFKTGYCNLQIINGFSESNTITICVTKNTLEANEQWLIRLFKQLDDRFPYCNLNDKIMIISSEKEDLNGNATHCKSLDIAWGYLKKHNQFKIIFICSNKIRILDILEIVESSNNLIPELRRNFRIIHDEAHNDKEGIPPFRCIIENILVQPNVLSYQPVTASMGQIPSPDNLLWNEKNLEKYAINFTEFDKTKSDDPNYSSIADYIQIPFESLSDQWVDYNITSVSREDFIQVDDTYSHISRVEDLTPEQLDDVDHRRELEFCRFMEFNKEKEALNNGLNHLNLNKICNIDLFVYNIFNIHIISTPNRKILTQYLCNNALTKDYDPIVLGIFGNQGKKFHLYINGRPTECVDHIMKNGEFNEKLIKLFNYLRSNNINIERPFIIIGNYNPTGESLTFVHSEYGTVRCNCKLISTTVQKDYQEAARGNYMKTKFLEQDSLWISPEKYLIGPKQFIENALDNERENDARVENMLQRQNTEPTTNDTFLPEHNRTQQNTTGTTAIPIKIMINPNQNDKTKVLIEIANKLRRTEEDKKIFLHLLKECIEDDEIECEAEDKTGKFNFNTFTLKDFRCYRKKEQPPPIGQWKFPCYQNHFAYESPFINDTSNHEAGECEILVCKDLYIIKDSGGNIRERNTSTTWWIGYKY